MYNLFVISTPDYWEENRRYECERSRAFEYLDVGISDEYRDDLPKRKELPCLFSYEGFDGHGRIGRLQSVREDAKRVAIEYQLDDAFPPIPIFNEATYSRFGCAGFECNRTHWTIKNIDLYKVVAEIYGQKILDTKRSSLSAAAMERIWGSRNAGHARLFLSHKAVYRSKVAELAKSLNANGINTFVAHHDVKPSLEWRNEIRNALNTMTHFIALLTDDFNEGSWTNQEMGYSFGRDTPRLFVKLSNVDPSGLASAEQALVASWVNVAEKIDKWLANG